MLDAAGTLITPSEPVAVTYARVAKRYGAELDVGTLAQAFTEVFGDMPDLAFEWRSAEELHGLEREWWRTLVRRVVARTGTRMRGVDDYFETLYQHYAEGGAWKCFPEVTRVLEWLRGRGFKLAVVSNFDSRLPGILRALGVHPLLDAVIYSSEAGSTKPNPAIFRRALAALGVPPQQAVHVGDNATADVAGAADAGLTGVLIQRGDARVSRSPRVISSLDELPAWLQGARNGAQ